MTPTPEQIEALLAQSDPASLQYQLCQHLLDTLRENEALKREGTAAC